MKRLFITLLLALCVTPTIHAAYDPCYWYRDDEKYNCYRQYQEQQDQAREDRQRVRDWNNQIEENSRRFQENAQREYEQLQRQQRRYP